jgi:PPOX class probable F420-dependent enzyme
VTGALHDDRVTRRLTDEPIGWLTTVSAGDQPQSSPVWFVWDGASLWLRSRPEAAKVRNIASNQHVAFHLADDGHGGDIVTIEGLASLEQEPDELLAAYLAKYDDAIRTALQTSPDQLAAEYSSTIRITPTRTRAW